VSLYSRCLLEWAFRGSTQVKTPSTAVGAGRFVAVTTVAFLAASCSSSAPSPSVSGGNGEASKSSSQVVSDTLNAMKGLDRVHIAGDVNQNGQDIRVDFVLSHTVGGGTMSMGGNTFQLIDNGTNAYLMGDASFWQHTAGADASTAGLLAGRWITGFSGQDLKGISRLTNLDDLLGSLNQSGKITKGRETTFNGRSVIELTSSDGGVGYVAATGSPYLLEIKGPPGQGKIVFNEFDTARLPRVPTNAIDFTQIGH